MKKTLFIGSVVLDILVKMDHLPKIKEDINTESVHLSVGGCAYNAYNIVRQFQLPSQLCSAMGTGQFANLLEVKLKERKIEPVARIAEIDNGCCLCLINKEGERTFLCQHGAEYLFRKEWLKNLDMKDVDYVYVCGLEIEDESGEEILSFLEETKAKVFFAPGARICQIQQDRMKRMLALHPLLHLNEEEATAYTHCETVSTAAKILYEQTQEVVIITCGGRGAYYTDGKKSELVKCSPQLVVDTVGAGDSHAGACLAGLKMGLSLEKMLKQANKIAGKVVSVEGAGLSDEEFNEAVR